MKILNYCCLLTQHDKQLARKTWLKNAILKSYSVLCYEIENNIQQGLTELR